MTNSISVIAIYVYRYLRYPRCPPRFFLCMYRKLRVRLVYLRQLIIHFSVHTVVQFLKDKLFRPLGLLMVLDFNIPCSSSPECAYTYFLFRTNRCSGIAVITCTQFCRPRPLSRGPSFVFSPAYSYVFVCLRRIPDGRPIQDQGIDHSTQYRFFCTSRPSNIGHKSCQLCHLFFGFAYLLLS